MILIGFIFVGAAVAIGVDVGMENSGARLSVEAFGHTFSQPPWVVVAVGAVFGAVALIGIGMMVRGTSRRRRLWVERRGALRQRDRLACELAELRADLDRAERQQATGGVGTEPRVSLSERRAVRDDLTPGSDGVSGAQGPVEPDPVSQEPTPTAAAVAHHRRLLRR
jgi:hypothetical protein